MDQRHDQRLRQRSGLLAREAARQIEPALLQQAGDAGEGVGAQGAHRRRRTPAADDARGPRERASMLLAAPATGQGWRGDELHARIALHVRRCDHRGAIDRTVVEHHESSYDPLARESGAKRTADVVFLVARRDQQRDTRLRTRPARGRRTEDHEIDRRHQRREQCKREGGIREYLQHHALRRPCSGSKRSLRAAARAGRNRS
jgi:hypothetical protein